MTEKAPVLRSALLSSSGFAHGFSTRHGGVSAGPFDQLNLGRNVGDDPECVRENHLRMARWVGYESTRLFESSQVHGAQVLDAGDFDRADDARGCEADALIARAAGAAVGVRTADCVPVLLADVRTGCVAAVHAGWRGVVAGVVATAVRSMGAHDAGTLVAAVGPSIGPCCFEVGEDVASELELAVGCVLRSGHSRAGKPRVDIWLSVESQLRALGVARVDRLDRCTFCDPTAFHSFRRDGRRSGRMLSVIVAGEPERTA